jgi:hypothetical protein
MGCSYKADSSENDDRSSATSGRRNLLSARPRTTATVSARTNSSRPATTRSSTTRGNEESNQTRRDEVTGREKEEGERERSERNKSTTRYDENQLLDHLLEMGKRRTGLQDKTRHTKPPYEYRNSYNLNGPGLKRGHRLYLNDLCYTYSIFSLKQSKQEQFMTLLNQRNTISMFDRP